MYGSPIIILMYSLYAEQSDDMLFEDGTTMSFEDNQNMQYEG